MVTSSLRFPTNHINFSYFWMVGYSSKKERLVIEKRKKKKKKKKEIAKRTKGKKNLPLGCLEERGSP